MWSPCMIYDADDQTRSLRSLLDLARAAGTSSARIVERAAIALDG